MSSEQTSPANVTGPIEDLRHEAFKPRTIGERFANAREQVSGRVAQARDDFQRGRSEGRQTVAAQRPPEVAATPAIDVDDDELFGEGGDEMPEATSAPAGTTFRNEVQRKREAMRAEMDKRGKGRSETASRSTERSVNKGFSIKGLLGRALNGGGQPTAAENHDGHGAAHGGHGTHQENPAGTVTVTAEMLGEAPTVPNATRAEAATNQIDDDMNAGIAALDEALRNRATTVEPQGEAGNVASVPTVENDVTALPVDAETADEALRAALNDDPEDDDLAGLPTADTASVGALEPTPATQPAATPEPGATTRPAARPESTPTNRVGSLRERLARADAQAAQPETHEAENNEEIPADIADIIADIEEQAAEQIEANTAKLAQQAEALQATVNEFDFDEDNDVVEAVLVRRNVPVAERSKMRETIRRWRQRRGRRGPSRMERAKDAMTDKAIQRLSKAEERRKQAHEEGAKIVDSAGAKILLGLGAFIIGMGELPYRIARTVGQYGRGYKDIGVAGAETLAAGAATVGQAATETIDVARGATGEAVGKGLVAGLRVLEKSPEFQEELNRRIEAAADARVARLEEQLTEVLRRLPPPEPPTTP